MTSVAELPAGERSKVEAALQKKAGSGSKLIVTYETNPALMGGLLVSMGDAVFDLSVSTKLDKLQGKLMAPV